MTIFTNRIHNLLALLFVLLPFSAHSDIIHRNGCDNQMPQVRLCWDMTAEEESLTAPYDEVHLLPIMQMGGGRNAQPLVDLSRAVYRQILPGNFALNLVQEWEPYALHLDEALSVGRRKRWPMVLWISPRVMRNSSSMTQGLVDWDVFLLDTKKGKPERTVRIRVEANPKPGKDSSFERGAGTYVLAKSIGLAAQLTSFQTVAMVGAATAANGDSTPPQAGQPLELLNEMAVRQIIFLMQHPISELNPPPDPKKIAAQQEAEAKASHSPLASFGEAKENK